MPLPKDINGATIPALSLADGGGHTLAATTGASARNATPFKSTTQVISINAKTEVWIAFGDETVTVAAGGAGVHYFPAGVYYDFAIGGFVNTGFNNQKVPQKTHVAVRAVSADGAVYISEKE